MSILVENKKKGLASTLDEYYESKTCFLWGYQKHAWTNPRFNIAEILEELQTGMERKLDLETKAKLGEQILSNLPVEFQDKNVGRYIAVTFSGDIIAVADTIHDLNRSLLGKVKTENYFLARLGHKTLTEID
ncbi:MAG: hypothetical protein ACYC7D_14825 [Nitrososphaerales archaeon]